MHHVCVGSFRLQKLVERERERETDNYYTCGTASLPQVKTKYPEVKTIIELVNAPAASLFFDWTNTSTGMVHISPCLHVPTGLNLLDQQMTRPKHSFFTRRENEDAQKICRLSVRGVTGAQDTISQN